MGVEIDQVLINTNQHQSLQYRQYSFNTKTRYQSSIPSIGIAKCLVALAGEATIVDCCVVFVVVLLLSSALL
jgi:hypothetical protein